MAKKQRPQNTSSVETRSFQKGMTKDVNETLMPDGSYLSARNAVNNSRSGDLGVLGNEAGNKFCAAAPYPVIGAIHVTGDRWAIFSTDDVNSEIGEFDESLCEYKTVVNDPCLGFKRTNPILGGEAKENFDCSWEVYFADDLNPDRSLNLENVPWIQNCAPDPNAPDPNNPCILCVDTTDLDCELLRMARITIQPCLKMEQGPNGGELLNGTYQAVIAYTENEQRISDYSIPSNIVSMFDHRNVNGSIDIIIESIDQTYDEFELVVIGFVNQQLVARKIGIYSTHTNRISLDKIDATLPAIPLSVIPLDRPAYERSQGIYRNGEFLIRVAPTSRFSFNYQPLANQINTKWVSVQYPAGYYRNGGTRVGYLRDEVYSFFIRWIYTTNDKSESYHIPGRVGTPAEKAVVPSDAYTSGFQFEEFNTASAIPTPVVTLPDKGIVQASGPMGYWESSENYPDQNQVVWGALCGQKIRHHKMPDSTISPHFGPGGVINVLGVEFNNIPFPVDNNNVPIPGIAGYEILRGSREGNKTVIAKGLINNMQAYNREDGGGIAYYQNYPYNDMRPDPFLNVGDFWTGDIPNTGIPIANVQGNALGGVYTQTNKFTFHSPDTQFKHPFLSAQELRVYENHSGFVDGTFNEPYKHPEHKLVTDFTFILAALVGFGLALKAMQGVTRSTRASAKVAVPPAATDWTATYPGVGLSQGGGIGYGVDWGLEGAAMAATIGHQGALVATIVTQISGIDSLLIFSTGAVGEMLPGNVASLITQTAGGSFPGADIDGGQEFSAQGETGLPMPLAVLQAIPAFLGYWSEGTQTFLDLVQAFSRSHQYALQYDSHCFYDSSSSQGNIRAGIADASYISDRLQEFGGITMNNLYRSSCVGITLNPGQSLPGTPVIDTSRNTFKYGFQNVVSKDNVGKQLPQGTNGWGNAGRASSWYVGLKSRLRNQYGQMDGIKQVPTSSCMQIWETDPTNPPNATSEIIFGGDTYIGRYTEKNAFFYFFDWMLDLPDEFEYDYRLRKMMPYPTYWMDTHDFQVNDFITGLFDMIFGGGGSGVLPSSWHNFDTTGNFSASSLFPGISLPPSMPDITMIISNAYMYLFNNGVRDFIVESEVNVEYRDWGEEPTQRHYDPEGYVDLISMFRSDRIKAGNFWKYDYSLQASRYYQGFGSWGSMQFRNYDPVIAEQCYTYYPNRVIYSLPQEKELRYDNWLVYLINNYKDFTSRVTTIKAVGKNGAMMLFENEAPALIPGVDTLQTTSGTKITIGDGGLFSQPLQNIVNADQSYEYGSCQDKLSVINTPAGLFWISQNQGKIFNYSNQLDEISQQGMKWWFDEFLPYKIIEDFPNFDLLDNTVIGVGCQSIYDNSDGIMYFTKRDFRLRPEFSGTGRVQYLGADDFQIDKVGRFKLGDPRYFDSASWTISYDPKAKAWISFHDWHPNFLLPSKNNFMSILGRGIWKHNDTHHSYCNYYGVDYPFEIELVTPTGQTVNTLKSIEYQMEVFQWDQDGIDRNHVLDFNFDKAVVYNTEQMSGELRLNLTAKNNAPDMLNFPRVNPNSIDILYSKVEQKYRFNQFWDITDDRGEFTNARRMMWQTSPNGYTKEINPQYVNYNKAQTQRKKFRHYQSNLWLRRMVSGVHNMQLKVVNSKNQYSPR